ncbi:MAG: DegV family protein [Oscillospiraceae bacterium]|nr:DegV family protein [Oscillospiraceae bacterium]
MSRIAVITDTNSSMTQEEADRLGVYLVPMPFMVDGKEYFEGVDCTYEQFFAMLAGGGDVSTSQPSPDAVTTLWDRVLEEYDAIIHIPMSSALSSSCATAKALAAEYEGRVFVADNKRISISQRESVLDALTMIGQGMEAADICAKLEAEAFASSIYLAVNTLDLLKKSGRVTAAGAAVAAVLGIKPVLQIQGEKLDAFAKVRGMANAEKTMLNAAKKDLESRFAGKSVRILTAYSGEDSVGTDWVKKVQECFGDDTVELYQLPISICCHVGAGVKGIGIVEYVK